MRLQVIGASLLLTSLSWAADQRGEWTMGSSGTGNTVTFSIEYSQGADHHNSNSSNWQRDSFAGLDFTAPSKHDVHFSIERDAGTFECQGFLAREEGAGLFTFHPHPDYARQMAALGFDGVTGDKLFAAALEDVSLPFARSMRGQNIEGLNFNKLMACRIFHVTPDYIHKLKAHGLQDLTFDKILALRIQGIS